jgi:Rrf2 family protein
MKISAQEEFGLRCLLRFASSGPGASLTIQEIAAGEGLSVPYVAKLLAVLRQGGLIESERGRAGGYRLKLVPSEIGLGSVLLVLGEPLFDEESYCERHAGTHNDGHCVHQTACSLRGLWRALEQCMRGALNRITLADLLQDEGRIPELVQPQESGKERQRPKLPVLS